MKTILYTTICFLSLTFSHYSATPSASIGGADTSLASRFVCKECKITFCRQQEGGEGERGVRCRLPHYRRRDKCMSYSALPKCHDYE